MSKRMRKKKTEREIIKNCSKFKFLTSNGEMIATCGNLNNKGELINKKPVKRKVGFVLYRDFLISKRLNVEEEKVFSEMKNNFGEKVELIPNLIIKSKTSKPIQAEIIRKFELTDKIDGTMNYNIIDLKVKFKSQNKRN